MVCFSEISNQIDKESAIDTPKSKLSFLGAARTVTGSRYLLQLRGKNILIDCGLFQGRKEHRVKNWRPFQFPPSEIDAVALTHAHIDHVGYLPRLVKDGFKGPVYCTDPTADLVAIMLRDSARIQEEDAEWANKKGYSKHDPALPLYTVRDAEAAIRMLEPVHYGYNIEFENEGFRMKFRDAGHILGSSYIDIKTRTEPKKKILFGGDLGRPNRPILKNPVQAFDVDYLVIESTYGDRAHPDSSPYDELARVICEADKRGGGIIIPSFAVERTQELLYVIRELEEKKKVPVLPVFVDSPMAIDATEIFERRIAEQDLESRVLTMKGVKILRPKNLRFSETVEQSKAIVTSKGKAIIISASGMATGGRILHHLKKRLPHPENTVVFVGYQVSGTRGRQLLDGTEKVRIHGEDVPVNATIENINGFSGHADYNVMLAWLMGFNRRPEATYLVHGELESAESLKHKIEDHFGWTVHIPEEGSSWDLDM